MPITAPLISERERDHQDDDGPTSLGSDIAAHRPAPEASDRDQMLQRMRSLRRILPVLAQEMAAARRQAARLRTDNRRLTEQVRELRATLEAREHTPA